MGISEGITQRVSSRFLVGLLLFFLGFSSYQPAFALRCREALEHIHFVSIQEGMRLRDVREILTPEEMVAIRDDFKQETALFKPIFEQLLKENGLKIARENEEGIPVLESTSHPENASSLTVLSALIKNRINFQEKGSGAQDVDEYDELARIMERPEILSQLTFKSSVPGFELFVDLSHFGLVVGMKRTSDSRVVLAGVPEGGETYSAEVLDYILNSLIPLN